MEPLTPAVLNKLPLGLLGFFGIKNGGQYPQSLGVQISPTMEMQDLLAINYCVQVAGGSNPPALGFVTAIGGVSLAPIVVPAGELWYVTEYSGLVQTGAGDALDCTMGIRSTQTGGASACFFNKGPYWTQTAGKTWLTEGAARPFWAAPGDQFGWYYSTVTNPSGTAQATCQIRYVRFPF